MVGPSTLEVMWTLAVGLTLPRIMPAMYVLDSALPFGGLFYIVLVCGQSDHFITSEHPYTAQLLGFNQPTLFSYLGL